MKKRLPTSIVILVFTIGFVLLRQFSKLFFDAFALILMFGAVIEMALANKFSNKKVTSLLKAIIPIPIPTAKGSQNFHFDKSFLILKEIIPINSS